MAMDAPPAARPGQPDWFREGANWPHRDVSQFIPVGAHVLHVQRMGAGPVALLIHGTGAATHSWAGVMPLLAEQYDVIALDLPGHGFSRAPAGFIPRLDAMAGVIKGLLETLDCTPSLVVGHSAGAAIMVQLAGHHDVDAGHLVSLNGALKPFPGLMSVIAPRMARALTFGGLAANIFASSAGNRKRVERLLEQTGGMPPAPYVDAYQDLLGCSSHVSATLNMMANWDLGEMPALLAHLQAPILFMAGARDGAITPGEAPRLARLAPAGEALILPNLGHLAHEQDPAAVHRAILDWMA